MRVLLGGIELAGWYDSPASSVSVNGQQLVEPVALVAALTQRLLIRGNKVISFQFTTVKQFASIKEAEVFVLAAFSYMTTVGTLEVQCGEPGDYQSVFAAGTVIQATPSISYKGKRASITYSCLFPAATTSTPPQSLLGGDDMILRSSDSLSAGQTYKDITFETEFAAAPVVTANIAVPSGGAAIWANPRKDLTTTTGTRIEFQSIPASGYYLNWTAC